MDTRPELLRQSERRPAAIRKSDLLSAIEAAKAAGYATIGGGLAAGDETPDYFGITVQNEGAG